MRISFTNLSRGIKVPNFASRVIYERSPKDLDTNVIDFIDTFEERFPKQSDGRRHVNPGYTNGKFTIFDIAAGESGQVYMVQSDKDSSIPRFVIKESFPLKYKLRADSELGGLAHEYAAMCQAASASPNTQKPLGYVITANGASFLLSKFIPNIKPVNYKTSPDGKSGQTMGIKYFNTALKILEEFDDANFFDPDLTRANMSVDVNDGTAKALDFQWALLRGTHSKNYNKVFTFAPCEVETNCAAFEGGLLADYPIGELKKATKNLAFDEDVIADTKANIRKTLKDYLKLRAVYAQKLGINNDFEAIKAKVFQNPSDDVLDAELLRMSLLRNNRLQFLYTDDNIEKPRNMMKLIRYSALAKFSAKKLANFEPKYPPRTSAEEKYFEYMRKFGKHWSENMSSWYPESIEFLENIVKGRDKAPGRYFSSLFKQTKEESFTLFDVMNNNAKCDTFEVDSLVTDLERSLLAMQRGKYVASYDVLDKVKKLYCY